MRLRQSPKVTISKNNEQVYSYKDVGNSVVFTGYTLRQEILVWIIARCGNRAKSVEDYIRKLGHSYEEPDPKWYFEDNWSGPGSTTFFFRDVNIAVLFKLTFGGL